MKKVLLPALLSAVMSLTAAAQDNVYLIKGNKVVAKFPVADVDYVSFKLPEGVSDGYSVAPEAVDVGKNFIKYKVACADEQAYYGHAFFQSQLVDKMLRVYYNTNLSDVDDATLKEVMRLLLVNFGYMDQGTLTFTIKDGDNDGYGKDFFVPGGQDFYVVTCNVTDVNPSTGEGTVGDELSILKMTTNAPGESSEKISVEYVGLDASDDAVYDIQPGDGIKTMYVLLGKKKELDESVSLYGYDYVTFSLASAFTAEEWKQYSQQYSWELDGEDDYVMNVLGVDANGDWVKASAENHIVVASDNCPKVNLLSKSKGDGKATVNFEITPSNVTAAHYRLMADNDVSDALNAGKTLKEIAVEGDADDVTSVINEQGEYTFSGESFPARWNALLISATDDNGTNVTRVVFNPYIDSEWEVTTTTFPTAASGAPRKTAAVSAVKGKKAQPTGLAAGRQLKMRRFAVARYRQPSPILKLMNKNIVRNRKHKKETNVI